MNLTVTVYVKLVHNEFIDIFSDKNKDILTYLADAIIFHKSVLNTATSNLFFQKKDLDYFKEYKGSTFYAELEKKYQETQEILYEVSACQTDIEKCEYYCKYNSIKYIPKRVEFNSEN